MKAGMGNGQILAVFAGIALVVFGWQLGLGVRSYLDRPSPTSVVPLADSNAPTTIAVFEAARDSVVFISTAERVRTPWRRTLQERPRGTGSGFLWDAQGHVVTNWHVLEGASQADVRLADGTSLTARLVGAAPLHDLAVLRIAPPDLPWLSRGSSADLRVGQSVLAIGNPFGLDWTLTTGIVSALERDLPGERGRPGLRGLIQTDAAINPGNSGGPLLDAQGRLIGVNTAIFSPSGSSAGIGFAVPVDTVARVVPQLIERGRYQPPGIGIETDARVNRMAARQGIDGVLVLDVRPGTPAAQAGLEPARMTERGLLAGDRIVAVEGEPVSNPDQLRAAFDRYGPGAQVTLTIRRGRQTDEITLPLVDILPG